jgi:endosialidase-like protein
MRYQTGSRLETVLALVIGLGCVVGGPAGAGAAGPESTFVGLTPCRLADTRGNGFGDPFGPPALVAGIPRDFPLQGQCAIPATAGAVSLNVTATNTQGPGFLMLYPQGGVQPLVSTLNYLAGETVANAAIVPLGPGGLTVVAGVSGTDLILDVNGYFGDSLVHELGTDSILVGRAAGNPDTAGQRNTGVGVRVLESDTTGNNNTAVGFQALASNTIGFANTAIGMNTLRSNAEGNNNTATGRDALSANQKGDGNTAMGVAALLSNTTGDNNVAVGASALQFATGSGNVAVGTGAGLAVTTGSNNILIGSGGAAESATIRIGQLGVQSKTFIVGIHGVTTDSAPAIQVLVDTSGQLGTISSSRRTKEAIEPMGEDSGALLSLRPVTFRYRQATADGTKPRQYGLIAEEVAEVYPDLVAYGPDGQPETVLYHVLPAMLLNELQRQEREIQIQRIELAAKSRELDDLRRRLEALERSTTGRP